MMRVTFLAVLISALTSALVSLAVHYYIIPRLPVPTVEVPPVVGLSPEQARGLLEPRGLLLSIDGERQDGSMAPGNVVQQTPLGGSRFRRGELVHVFLARAPGPVRVPKLDGMSVAQAREALQAAGLSVGKLVDAPAQAGKGMVASTAPQAGTELAAGSQVELTVSLGPAETAVPSLLGKRLNVAKDLILKAGFQIGAIRYGAHDDYQQGAVISQSPKEGTLLAPGGKIDVVVND